MGILGKTTAVDQKLKRGHGVTMAEIVACYGQYETTPWGQTTPTPKSMKKVVRKVAEARDKGLLIIEDEEGGLHADARAAALEFVGADETIEAEGIAQDVGPMTPGGANIFVVVTDQQLAWALIDRPDAAAQMRFDQITNAAGQGQRLQLTQRDPAYAASLHDPSNPYGETDASLVFPENEAGRALYLAVTGGIEKLSPAFSQQRSMVGGLKALRNIPVAEWTVCPVCGASLIDQVEGGAGCGGCGRWFTDPNRQPRAVSEMSPNISIDGTKPWSPLMETQVAYRDRPLVWIVRPPGQTMGPAFVMDAALLDASS